MHWNTPGDNPQVTDDNGAASAETWEQARPRIHFTADDGWINDPYGIAWIDGQYHLYYQAVPGRVTWGPNCHWGHATSKDLVHWQEQPLALIPQDFEVGCWSGSVVDADPRTIFYTRVAGENWEIGQVATATQSAGNGGWRSGPENVVIDAPPPELQVRAFRDPFVFRREGDWALLMAAALPDGCGGVVQYTSPDLKRWSYDGLLCSRPADSGDGLDTGGVWECPQLFSIGDRWVLVVSVGNQGDLLYVAAAVGDYDGRTFEPARWQRLTYGASAYASTAFLDEEGRRCLLSWLREEPRDDPSLARRAGAHSVASTMSLDAEGTVVLAPHPDVDALRSTALTGKAADGSVRYAVNEAPIDVSTAVSAGLWCEIAEPEGWRARLYYDADRHSILVHRPQLATEQLPLPPGDVRVRALLDADILEIFTAGTYGAFRIAPAADPARTTLILGAADAETAVRPLTGDGRPGAFA